MKNSENKECLVSGCKEKPLARGLCRNHYYAFLRWIRGGGRSKKPRKWSGKCWIKNCDNPAEIQGLCRNHYQQIRTHDFEAEHQRPTGEAHHSWKGGVSDYPHHSLMKRNRLKKLQQVHGICEICKKAKATNIHHIDESKDNHDISNLLAVCKKCHVALHIDNMSKPRKKTKFIKIYGKSVFDMAGQLNTKDGRIRYLHAQGLLERALELNDAYFQEAQEEFPRYHKIGCKYSRRYGLTITEIAKKLGKSPSEIHKLHKKNNLDILLRNKNLQELHKSAKKILRKFY